MNTDLKSNCIVVCTSRVDTGPKLLHEFDTLKQNHSHGSFDEITKQSFFVAVEVGFHEHIDSQLQQEITVHRYGLQSRRDGCFLKGLQVHITHVVVDEHHFCVFGMLGRVNTPTDDLVKRLVVTGMGQFRMSVLVERELHRQEHASMMRSLKREYELRMPSEEEKKLRHFNGVMNSWSDDRPNYDKDYNWDPGPLAYNR